ncbi:hypothetical protein L0337_33035 [candidate division KSB1 bacterium]|nr:hypothetical protein [candidate division KSB1 bacterium]
MILAWLFTLQEAKYQLAENNVVVRFGEKRLESEAQEVLALAMDAREQLLEKYHLASSAPVEIRLSVTTAEFCQRTGTPWWQSSIYRNRIIYLQPVRVLRERGILATTLRHELMHQLVDERAKGNGPRWLYEALAIYNSGEIEFLKPRSSNENFNKESQGKPASQTATIDRLTWSELENRLQGTTSREESEHLYFQLYHLGRFLERKFQPSEITALLLQLGKPASLAQACREALGISAKNLEQNWLQYCAKAFAASIR